jgi:hypothetical protein
MAEKQGAEKGSVTDIFTGLGGTQYFQSSYSVVHH